MRPTGTKVVATNRQARRNYSVLETVEAGLVLQGSEVKSLRESKVQIADAFARIDRGEAWLHALHIAPYTFSQDHSGHDPDRKRKLLLHHAEIAHLQAQVDQQGLSLVPLSIYFKDGRAKVELALARGRKTYDKRQALAERDAAMDVRRAMARGGREE
jgi:SsrA-binding protein